jgi:multidrug transporter EmrE-like cation transporter
MKKRKKWKIPSLGLLFIGGVILTLGDIVAAYWVREGGGYLYLAVIILYLVGMVQLVASYKSEDIPVASTILVIFNVIILTIVGAVMFGEEVSFTKISGILLCFVALVLLEFGKGKRKVGKL